MRKLTAVWVGTFLICGLVSGMSSNRANAEGPIVVPLKSPSGVGDPFPIGWAAIDVAKGETTFLAILPANTVVPGSGESDPSAGKWAFEAWIADLAPPHLCPAPEPIDGTGEVIDNGEDAFLSSDPDVVAETPEAPICGSRVSSETRFRNFPGIPNKTFQKTYFPVSQGLLHKVGPDIGDWALYTGRHKTNMGLRPFDVAGVTVEPPGTGARLRDYDPRPNPVVALIGRIPHPTVEEGEGESDVSGATTGSARRRAANALSIR